ncbi:mismatch-specific DNA-glycosylase [Williamsia sp.]|uniref:mismatch-specific DNA-glycosylase n=1 Tax=Williamsia sp. TaxID=1872085 RepID=UPI001A220CAA|nr:mismatch-specific DNA-glycosylase [Williamsia sp.]MBJ7287301.1 mismatch-specific DNA-glycosylase [Williamsia sp.]
MGFTKAELAGYRDAVVDDLIGDNCRLLFVGINPSLWTAATGAHFARPGNRFYPALHRAGILDRLIDASDGYTAADREMLLRRGIGITNLAPRATARADELTSEELRDGTQKLLDTVRRVAPRVVAVAGITAYRTAFRRPRAVTGEQDEKLAGTPLWVVPNPSGLNAHDTVDSLAAAYRRVGLAAGMVDAG